MANDDYIGKHLRPGEYRLRSTGEVVVDPDYVCSWTIKAPPPEADK